MRTASCLTLLRRPCAVWLALCVALFAASAPSVSHALAYAKGAGTGGIEICTAQGPKIVVEQASADADATPAQDVVRTLDHCPFCLQPSDHAAPPLAPQHHHFGVHGGKAVEPGLQSYFYTLSAFSLASPRGPPALS